MEHSLVDPGSHCRFKCRPTRLCFLRLLTLLLFSCSCTSPRTTLAFEYILDDGTAEVGVGTHNARDLIFLNFFTVSPGAATISSISIAFYAGFQANENGAPFQAVLWSDPNSDGNPSDATVLATANGVIANAGTNTFVTVSISPTTVNTPNFFVGFLMMGTPAGNLFPAALDTTSPSFLNRSFLTVAELGTGNIFDLTANTIVPLETTEANGGPVGNWLIRAGAVPTGSVPDSGDSAVLLAIACACIAFLRRLYTSVISHQLCLRFE